MRFNSASFLLGLAALGSVPETFGRAVSNSAVDLHYGNHARAAPVRITPPKEVPPVKPGGGTPSHTGDKPDGEGTPARIGAGDKTPDTKSDEQPVHIGDDNSTPDLWCRGTGCGGESPIKPAELVSPEALMGRGEKGITKASAPQKGTDFTQKENDNYSIKKDEAEDVEDSIGTLGYDKKYGFDLGEDGWQKMEIRSKAKTLDAVVEMSVGRATKDGKDYVAIVAHKRFAENDGNRYEMDANGAAKEVDGKLVPAANAGEKAVPVSQLLHDAAKQSGKLDGNKPDKFLLVSENVINKEAQRDITAAHEAMGKKGQPLVLKNGASGPEGDYFKLLAGNDNNYSYLNTVGTNPDTFAGYRIISIETRESPPTMAIELSKV